MVLYSKGIDPAAAFEGLATHRSPKNIKRGTKAPQPVSFRSKKLPQKFMGHKVFNADKSDLRFKDPKNIIAGLYAKGQARHDNTGFVQDV